MKTKQNKTVKKKRKDKKRNRENKTKQNKTKQNKTKQKRGEENEWIEMKTTRSVELTSRTGPFPSCLVIHSRPSAPSGDPLIAY